MDSTRYLPETSRAVPIRVSGAGGSLWPSVEQMLSRVTKPARYIGGESGAVKPLLDPGELICWLLVYPDVYEIGLPNQGLQILYEILNERPDARAERAYAPWVDMEAAMRAAGVPLFSLESHRPAAAFDVIAFNLSAELTYTNVLNCLDLAGLRVRSEERSASDPLVIAGGHAALNPEPLAPFIDAFAIGDGEELAGECTDVLSSARAGGASREELLKELARVPGMYVPWCYKVSYSNGRLAAVEPRFDGVPERVEKRAVADLAAWPYPKTQLVPLMEVVHDRLNVEVFRGCTRGCRFCQAGMITRPVRERPEDQVLAMVRSGLARTGYDEVALTSLSSADYSFIEPVVDACRTAGAGAQPVSVSLPSLRVDAFTVGLAGALQGARRTGLTFAPEAGTWRLRRVINKLISDEDLYGALESAFSGGWRRAKCYFLIGLPTETDEDVESIAALARRCVELGREHARSVTVTVSVGGFVPKPHTPFQWAAQAGLPELHQKIALLRDSTRGARGVNLRWHDPEATLAEGIASRGDRRAGDAIEAVWRAGGVFQEWSEHFRLERWAKGMAAAGLDMGEVVNRERDRDDVLPWDHISAGLHKDFLWEDWQDSLSAGAVEDCRWTPCYDCGACTGLGVEHVVASSSPPAGGSQGTGQALLPPDAAPPDVAPPEAAVIAGSGPVGCSPRVDPGVPVMLRGSSAG